MLYQSKTFVWHTLFSPCTNKQKQTPKTPMTANNHRLQNVHNHISTKNHHHINAKKGPQSHTHIDKEPPSQQCKIKSTITYSHRQRTTITTMQKKAHNHILTTCKIGSHTNTLLLSSAPPQVTCCASHQNQL